MEKFELKKNLRSNSQTAGLADKRLSMFSSEQLKKDKHFDKLQEIFEFNPEKYIINSDLKDQEMQEKRTKENKSSVKFEKQLEDTMVLITQRLEHIETTLNDFMQDYKKLSQAYIQSLERITVMQQKQIQSCLDMIIEKHKGESNK